FSPRPGDYDVVASGLNPLGELPEGLPDGTPHLVPGHRLADLPAHRQTEPRTVLRLIVAAGEGVDDQEAVGTRIPLSVDTVEVAAPGEAAAAGIGAALGGQR